MRRRAKIAAGVIVGVIASSGVASGGAGSMAPGDAVLSTDRDRTRVEVGTFCAVERPVPGEPTSGLCADAIWPTEPPRPRLDVSGRERITIRFERNPNILDEIADVNAALVRFGDDVEFPDGKVRARDLDERRWLLRLPRDLKGANALDIFVELENGDADYVAGLR